MEVTRIINDKPAQTYHSDWIVENQNELVNGELVSNWDVAPKYDDNFVTPKWDGINYYESATPEEVQTIKSPIYEKKIVSIYSMLYERALRSSMGKGYEYDTYQKLKDQEDEYRNKYGVAKGLIYNPLTESEIIAEMNREFTEPVLDAMLTSFGLPVTGTPYEKMCAVIMFKFEYGEEKYKRFRYYASTFRIKCREFVKNGEFTRCDSAFELAESIPLEMTVSEAEVFFNQFDSI